MQPEGWGSHTQTHCCIRDLPAGLAVITGLFDHVPAILIERQIVHSLFPDIEKAQPFRAQQPLVTICHGKVALYFFDIKPESTDGLDRIDTEQNSRCFAGLANFGPAGAFERKPTVLTPRPSA